MPLPTSLLKITDRIKSLPPLGWLLLCLLGIGFTTLIDPRQLTSIRFPLAFIIALAASLLACSAIVRFKQKNTTVDPRNPEASTALVVDNVYAISRNPMYLAMSFFIVAFAIAMGSLLSTLWVLLFYIMLDRLQIPREEASLRLHFSEQYIGYCREVNRWI